MDFAVNPGKIQAASVHIYKANVKLIALVLYMDVMTGTCYTNSVASHCWSDNFGIPNGLKGKGVFFIMWPIYTDAKIFSAYICNLQFESYFETQYLTLTTKACEFK